jgi:CRP-like cAMP-binding protein
VAGTVRTAIRAGQTVSCGPGTIVVVLDGAVAVLPPWPVRRWVADVLGPGEAFAAADRPGPLARTTPGRPVEPATWIRGLTPSRLLFVPAVGAAEQRCEDDAAHLLLGLMCARADRVERRLARALRLPAEERLLAELRDLAARFSAPDAPGGRRIAIPLTQELLADLTGGARETVNRSIGALARRGLVQRTGKSYSVRAPSVGAS